MLLICFGYLFHKLRLLSMSHMSLLSNNLRSLLGILLYYSFVKLQVLYHKGSLYLFLLLELLLPMLRYGFEFLHHTIYYMTHMNLLHNNLHSLLGIRVYYSFVKL